MQISPGAVRALALALKAVMVLAGVVTLILCLGYVTNESIYLSTPQKNLIPSISDIVVLVGIVCAILAAFVLISALPSSVRVRFTRSVATQPAKPAYGFGTVLAIGLGATLGSPLFILIPLNIVQYEFISLLSLLLATVLSILMAKLYANMYLIARQENLPGVGGPAFTKLATGTRSVRYFISRLSMAVANTALAAYSAIVFVLFDFQYIPVILTGYGVGGNATRVVVYSIAALFVLWFVVNSILGRRLMRLIGYAQVCLTVFMTLILIWQSYLIGSYDGWNLSGLFVFQGGFFGPNWVVALITNTAYLYLLFFGFQEIQAMEEDAVDTSSIPIISFVRKGLRLEKVRYLGVAMILSVIVAASVNIFYALAVYSAHPSLSALESSTIPALYLSRALLGANQETLMAVAFLTATLTTFVPSFLAASRHVSSMGEDGYMPRSIARFSWVFILASIALLAVAGLDFLVSVTDFMVLVSLGVISLSAIWIKKGRKSKVGSGDGLALLVASSCFVAAIGIYFLSPSVGVFGSLAIVFSYLVFDVLELGEIGTNMFLGVLCLVLYLFIGFYPHAAYATAFSYFSLLLPYIASTGVLADTLLVCAILLFSNAVLDALTRRRRRRSSGARGVARPIRL